MSQSPRLFNMKAVLRRTGLAPETLRAWERRYKAVVPSRSETGRRLYSDHEIERLSKLTQLVKMGQSIGQIARLSDRELGAMVLKLAATGKAPVHEPEFEPLMDSLAQFDLRAITLRLARIRYEISPREFMFVFIPQMMSEVGRLIEKGRLSVAQEHALSEIVQGHLRQIYDSLDSLDGTKAPKRSLIFAAPEGHFHEIGLMLAATLARSRGFAAQYFGPNLPAQDLSRAAAQMKPLAIVLSIAWLPPKERRVDVSDYVSGILEAMPKDCDLWIGGSGVPEVKTRRGGRKLFTFESLEDYEQKLARL